MATNIDPLTVLEQGAITVRGEFLWGSNYTFLVEIKHQDSQLSGVYKPNKGERPLWDFPTATLSRREVAAYLVSQALGWNLVPPTEYRDKGPLGSGSLQLYIEHDPEYHYFNFTEQDRQRLRPVVLFDLLINNADRKGSHILKDDEDHLWLIDHGVCFHVEDKLRTVVWDFIGEAVPDALCADILHLAQALKPVQGRPSGLATRLMTYLSRGEVRALANRASAFAAIGAFPPPDPHRRAFPWPQI